MLFVSNMYGKINQSELFIIIYIVMKYRKICINIMYILKKAVFHSRENISRISQLKSDVLCSWSQLQNFKRL